MTSENIHKRNVAQSGAWPYIERRLDSALHMRACIGPWIGRIGIADKQNEAGYCLDAVEAIPAGAMLRDFQLMTYRAWIEDVK